MKGREGKVVQVYRKKWVVHIDKITRDKANGKFIDFCLSTFWFFFFKIILKYYNDYYKDTNYMFDHDL